MTVVDYGHHLSRDASSDYDGNPSPGFDLCIPPTFDVIDRDGGSALDIVIEDDSARIHARFDDLFTQRAIARLGSAMVSAGDAIELAWTPAGDQLPSKLELAWADRTDPTSSLIGADNTIVDGHITIVAPEVAMPKSLELAVYNWSTAISAGASICEGVAGCNAEPENTGVLSLSYQIEP